ncbi:MAG: GntR family transcriptional regulator [Candidatus Brocadiia bacterium]
MYIPLDFDSGVPIFRQIELAIRRFVASGRLKAGEQVPSVRDLCAELRVNPATVNRAFRELELAGYVETRRGLGTFVAARPPRPSPLDAEEMLASRLDSIISDASLLGLSPEDLARMITRRALREPASGRNHGG